MLQFQTHVSESGVITLPPQAKKFYGKAVVVNVDQSPDDERQLDPARILPNGKTAVDDFLDFCKELNLSPLTDEEVEQVKFDYLMEKYG
jgi:predicted HicB family RNase H-like nuclease